MKKISIDPITRVEGHGKIEIFLNDDGSVQTAYLQVPELRGFEKFCEGRHVEELPRITAKICGVCPEAHHLASAKATDAVYKAVVPPAGKKLRELFYCAHVVHSHIAHFYSMASPDFIVGSDAPALERSMLGVIGKVGVNIGREVLKHRAYAQEIQDIIGGRASFPVCALPGGCSKALTEKERAEIETKSKSCFDFGRFTVKIFENLVLKDKRYTETILSKEIYYLKTHYMGMVDKDNKVTFYDGDVRIAAPDGKEAGRFAPSQYLDYISERVEPWSYVKFPYLKKVGWTGFTEGETSGVMRVGPLARLNVADGMPTPLAQVEYEKMFATLGGKPVHHTLAFHWARVIELLSAAERMYALSKDPEITSPEVRAIPTEKPSEGVGIVEAPRGTLIHHYKTNENGVVTAVNLIVATVFNNAAMNMSITRAAKMLFKKGKSQEALLNTIEMAFRAYDPCMSCASHCLPGRVPLVMRLHDSKGEVIETICRG